MLTSGILSATLNLKSCWSGIDCIPKSAAICTTPSLFVWETLCWSWESVTFRSLVLKSFRRHRFLIELPSLSVLFLSPSRYCVDVRIKLPAASTHLVNNNISRRLIQSVSFYLRLCRCLFFCKSCIFTPFQ
jgi:hypothetical protein